ncbi:fibrobacter succinogenes major paralogous domain-containing protein [Fibrobacter sp. UBA4297]|uniref:fibrobacter succinogenes major paralogous domain-containing protein n=1 Tax=Fibrobacter sp. UBA4297 TaxID=1946536 RepID=UPI0025BEF6E5|nr:fibrobacter succinogenes major paralogous domain-containing protein [Fibrobacter sp. UBA4297]
MILAFSACGDDNSSSAAPDGDEPYSSSITAQSSSSSKVPEPVEGASSSVAESSSSVEESSSSEVTSESSSSFADKVNCSELLEGETGWSWDVPKECRFNPDIDNGTMTDSRDGKTYKTVKIGDQVWMAENLNFDPGRGGSGENEYEWSWCHDNEPENCDVVGRLYTWAAAMDSVKLVNDADNPQDCGYGKECDLASRPATLVQGICDKGWHLPSRVEWNALFAAVGDELTAGKVLKSQTDWYNRNGADAFGFSALPAGRRGSDVSYDEEGYSVYFWSSTEISSNYAYRVYLEYDADDAALSFFYKDYGFSVRCLKD